MKRELPAGTRVLQLVVGGLLTGDEPWSPPRDPQVTAALRASYFLVDPHSRIDTFLDEQLPRLVQQLKRQTSWHEREYRGAPRGPILWPATQRARSRDRDPSRFICRESLQHHDTLENQLLRHLLACIADCAHALPPIMRRAVVCSGDVAGAPGMAERVRRIEFVLDEPGLKRRLAPITLPDAVDERWMLAAETCRIPGFPELARLQRRYAAVVQGDSWEPIHEIGRSCVVLPTTPAEDGKPWLQLGQAMLKRQLGGGQSLSRHPGDAAAGRRSDP